MIKFNDIEYNLYNIRKGDHFPVEDLKMFRQTNKVEYGIEHQIPETLEELENLIEKINKKFQTKTYDEKGWFLVEKEVDELSVIK